tara:strand:- start:5730 stop:8156 length:2427 start_codon:yes stop_codon:yes gene_type:complete
MKINYKIKEIYKFAYLAFALICTFWFISFFEVFSLISKGIKISEIGNTILYKLINDFWAAIIIGALLFPIYILLTLIHKKIGTIVSQVLFVIIILIQLSLVKYSLTTLLNLGADLLGYSYSDITTTVSSSETMSVGYFVPYVIAVIVFNLLIEIFKKFFYERTILAILFISILVFGGLKLVYSQSSDTEFQNKIQFLTSDILKYQNEANELNALNLSDRTDYPLLKPISDFNDVLSPFFNLTEQKPNIVFIIVEGLGAEFVGENYYSGFTPYLDSLKSKSLYWENFVSTAGRTFGVLPSLLGSLPFGDKGFLELKDIPSHISLISLLKANGYTTSFYSGDKSSFDRKINFLEYNGIDDIIDEDKFGDDFIKTEENSGGFSWGYPDAEIFKKTLSAINGKAQPRLDVIMTISNHEPFNFPSKKDYLVKVDSILKTKKKGTEFNDEIKAYAEIFATLLYTDASIKYFIDEYKKKPEFSNSIFIITGDHRLIPITQKDKLCRFHVPFFIYGPLLNQHKTFKSISSHFDVTPSLVSLLMNKYQFIKLDQVSWLSKGLDTAVKFRNIHKIPLMRYKGSINDYIYKDYLLSDGKLYKINENFGINKVLEKDLLKIMSDSLKEFKKLNAYTTLNNKIFPESSNIYMNPGIEFSDEELKIINEATKNLSFDQSFQLARETAFNKDLKKARLLCDFILNEYPNHADARILKGRTLAWDGKYQESEKELLNAIKRVPKYFDSYLAIMDLYWWSNQDEKSIIIAKQAFENGIINSDISFKLAKAYRRLNNLEESKMIMDSISKIYPENVDYKSFKQSLE